MPLVAKNYIGLKKETTWGTAVAPDLFLPVTSMNSEIEIARILDAGKRGVAAKDFASYAGTRRGKVTFGGMWYPDVPPRLAHGILGTDTISGAADPFTHTLTLADAPPSFTLADYDGISERRYPGCLITGLTLRFNVETGAFEYEVEAVGQIPADNTKSTETFGTEAPRLGWQASVSIAAGANTDLLGFELSLKRSAHLVFGAANSQNPNRGFAGGDLEVTGKLSFYAPDSAILDYYRSTTQPAVVITLNSTGGTRDTVITMTKCDFEKVTHDRGGDDFVRWDATVRALHNATDGGPVKIASKNAVATAF